jgi:lipoprotein-releasing system permease protein
VRVLTYGEDLKIVDWRELLERVRTHEGVVAAAPFINTQAAVNAGHDYVEGVYLAGIAPQSRDTDSLSEVTSIRRHAIQGDFRFASTDGLQRGVVLGKFLAGKLNAYPGDSITVGRPSARVNAATGLPSVKVDRFEVTGIFETGMYEYDNSYIYMSLTAAQDIASLDSAVTGIEVRTADRWIAPSVAQSLASTLGYPYRTQDWQEQNSSLFRALKLEKLGMGLILVLIILVAAFNIVSNLTMVVADKTREIGILKAMGMTARSIRQVFLTQGLVIGVVGTVVGVVLGMAVSLALGRYRLIRLDPAVYFIDHLPVATSTLDVIATVVASIAIATLATLYPAGQAAKLYPVEAIRHE